MPVHRTRRRDRDRDLPSVPRRSDRAAALLAYPHRVRNAVPDVLAPGLRVVFCGINPDRASAAAGAHYANPRNDFWRLLSSATRSPRACRRTTPYHAAELVRILEGCDGVLGYARLLRAETPRAPAQP